MNKLLTVKEVAAELRISPTTVYRLVKRQKIPYFRVGYDLRFDTEAIKRWTMRDDYDGKA